MTIPQNTPNPEIKTVPVDLGNGTIIRVRATVTEDAPLAQPGEVGEEIESDVSLNLRPLREVTDAIGGIANAVKETLQKVRPTRASVEFGLEFGYQSGQLTAIIVESSGTANLKIALEWEKEELQQSDG